jgi:hypothetical protein
MTRQYDIHVHPCRHVAMSRRVTHSVDSRWFEVKMYWFVLISLVTLQVTRKERVGKSRWFEWRLFGMTWRASIYRAWGGDCNNPSYGFPWCIQIIEQWSCWVNSNWSTQSPVHFVLYMVGLNCLLSRRQSVRNVGHHCRCDTRRQYEWRNQSFFLTGFWGLKMNLCRCSFLVALKGVCGIFWRNTEKLCCLDWEVWEFWTFMGLAMYSVIMDGRTGARMAT